MMMTICLMMRLIFCLVFTSPLPLEWLEGTLLDSSPPGTDPDNHEDEYDDPNEEKDPENHEDKYDDPENHQGIYENEFEYFFREGSLRIKRMNMRMKMKIHSGKNLS